MLKRPRTWWLLGALVLALVLVAPACDGGDDDDGEDGTPDAPATEAGSPQVEGPLLTAEDVLAKDGTATNEDVVRWGFMFELSGSLQGFGEPTGDGVKLAVKEINDAGGFQVGDTVYTIELVERDTASEVERTISATTELVRDEGVNVIWGPATVGEPEATAITQPRQILHICPCQERETTALETVEKAQGENRWAFQTLLPFSLLIEQGARNFIEDYPEFDTMALLCVNTANGRDICSRTREAYESVGVEVVGEVYFPEETENFTPFLTRLRSGDPDYLFNFHDPLAQATIIRQAIELDVGRLHIASLPANLIEQLVGVDLTVPVTAGAAPRQHVNPTTEEVEAYFERYRTYKEEQGSMLPFAAFVSLLTYDHTYMLVAAMQQAGTVEDTTAISEALEQIRYDGVAEDEMFFNSRHLGIHGTEPCVVQTGEPIECEYVPPPPEAME